MDGRTGADLHRRVLLAVVVVILVLNRDLGTNVIILTRAGISSKELDNCKNCTLFDPNSYKSVLLFFGGGVTIAF
jgi:hypothetical protein